MKQLFFYLSLIVVVFLASCKPVEEKITIGYVQITEDPVLDAAKAGVMRALADSGFIEGENIRIIDNNAQGDLSMINTILQSFQSQNADVIITCGTPCMSAAAQTIHDIPVVFTVSFGPEQVGLKTTPDNLFGVYDPLKAGEFIDLMVECIPHLKRVGIPYNNAEPNAAYSVEVLSREFTKRGITLITTPVTSSNDILQAGQYLVGQQIDALMVASDNTVYLGLPVLARLASEKHIPLFVNDPLQVIKGAAVGFGVDYDQWGYQSGLKAVQLLNHRQFSDDQIIPILTYDLVVNRKACAEQGLELPESVAGRAALILDK